MKKIIGILGGMGSQASCELYRLINDISVRTYGATRNADFPHLLISNLPVPDLISNQTSMAQTVNYIRTEIERLNKAGVTDLLMACNTMHVFQDDLFSDLRGRFHSLIDAVSHRLEAEKPNKTLILGSQTTFDSGLYQTALERLGLSYHVPDKKLQTKTVDVILKAIASKITNETQKLYIEAIKQEVQKDEEIDTILLACTELPLVFPDGFPEMKTISSLQAGAEKICNIYYESSAPAEQLFNIRQR